MVKITKTEMNYLKSQGFKNQEDIHKTVGSGKKATYFATESHKVLDSLEKFRQSRIVNIEG